MYLFDWMSGVKTVSSVPHLSFERNVLKDKVFFYISVVKSSKIPFNIQLNKNNSNKRT